MGAQKALEHVDKRALQMKLEDGSAWNPDDNLLVVIEATEAGHQAFTGQGA